MDNLVWGLQMTALGMGLVFGLLALLWGLLTLVQRWDRPAVTAPVLEAAPVVDEGMDPALVAAIVTAAAGAPRQPAARSGAGDAQPLAGQPAVCLALGGGRAHAAEPELAATGAVMRRYTLGIGAREFVVDVQELDADRFEVVVGEERFEVTLHGDEDLPEARVAAGAGGHRGQHRPPAPAAAVPRVARPRAAGTGLSALAAPMPGVILELHVKAGDRVRTRPGGGRARCDEDAQPDRRAARRHSSPRSASPPARPSATATRSCASPTEHGRRPTPSACCCRA